jgi:hypothetical protein
MNPPSCEQPAVAPIILLSAVVPPRAADATFRIFRKNAIILAVDDRVHTPV